MAKIETNKIIRLSKSSITDAEKRAVMQVLDHEYLGMGAEVQLFEQELTKFFRRPTVCVANGTAALHLSLQAVGIGAGDEVLVQSLTYVASFQAISATGAIPVACDVDPVTLCLDWQDAESRLTPKTKAVMPVHYAGGVGALDEIYAFAEKHGLRVIEDAAHAFGSEYNGRKIGSFGDVACFSFDGIKNITCGEGGCIVTNDKNILQKVRDSRLLGVERDTEKRYSGERSWGFDVGAQGWRYHMSNIMAAIGVEQLERFPELSNKRKQLVKLYDELLAGVSQVKPISNDYSRIVPHIYVVLLENTIDRVVLEQQLSESGIQTGIHYYPNHWLSLYHNSDVLIPTVDAVYPRLISLPLHTDLTREEVKRVCKELKRCVNEY